MTIFPVSTSVLCSMLATVLLGSFPGIAGEQESKKSELKRFEVAKKLMGVKFQLVVYGSDLESVRPAIQSALKRVSEIENQMSDYDPDSELMQLCRTAEVNVPTRVSADLFRVLSISEQVSRFSNGAFDPTLGHLTQIWRKARRSNSFPERSSISSALQKTGWQKIKLDAKKQTVVFLQKDLKLDLGGIAKGYAADEAIAVLRQHGFPRCLVDASGDVTVGDPPPGKDGWKIAIADQQSGQTLLVRNASVATSGDRFQSFVHDGKTYSHIVDPKTGYGTTHRNLVTVLSTVKKHPGAFADAYASAFSVMKPTLIQSKLNFSCENQVRIETHLMPPPNAKPDTLKDRGKKETGKRRILESDRFSRWVR